MNEESLSSIDEKLIHCAWHGDNEGIEKALSNGANPLTFNKNGHTALMGVAVYNNPKEIKLLLGVSDPN